MPPAGAGAHAFDDAYFRLLVENARDVIHVLNADRTTRYITPSVTHLLGYTPEELLGRDGSELVHPDDREAAIAALRSDRLAPGSGRALVFRVRHKDGSWRIFEGVGRNLLDDPAVRGVIVNSRDITERRRTEEETQRLAAFPREAPDPVLECDAGGALVYANPAALRLAWELGLDEPAGLLPPDHAAVVAGALACGMGARNLPVEIGGRVFSWTYHPLPVHRTAYLYGHEVTERTEAEARLRHTALHDPLTGLPNRAFFLDELGGALDGEARGGPPVAVLFLDLDRFKVVNDSLGHHVGDDLLVAVAGRLRGAVRGGDLVARFGGDEFAVLLRSPDVAGEAVLVADRIAHAVAQPVNLSGYEVFTSASIGIATCQEGGGERPEHLLRNADMAMYRAKASGVRRWEVFDRAMHAEALARLQVETDLRRALARQEFRLVYQPIASLRTGRIAGFEALLRWEHPDRGLIPPAEFIPTAEETGAILPLGDWVIVEACRTLAGWRADFPHARLAISVNLSAKQFLQTKLASLVRDTLAECGLRPRHLKLEITETALMDGAGAAAAQLAELEALGIEMQLDDFGTGYSSLASLHQLPLRALKVDRSFVSRLDEAGGSDGLVRTIALLADGLGLAVIAEGVETPRQLEVVRAVGCGFAQGFLLSPPLEAHEARALLARDLVLLPPA